MPTGTPNVDLTFDGASGTINGGVFMTGTYHSGPTTFSSFLEVRHNGTEQGYNTNGTLQYDTLDGQNSTHSVLLANVPIVIGDGTQGTVAGQSYRVFNLNIGEAGGAKQLLSLDSLQIWQEESGNLTNFAPDSGFAGSHTNYLVYNLDAGGDHWVALKEPINGNGAVQTEFTVLIPDSAFINDPSHRYITLYSKFGAQASYEADSSSEFWGLSVNSTGPTPAMTVHKTATVPGGTADHAGEVISYAITVANVGDVNLTGITVADPSVSNLHAVLSGSFNVGDTNHDNQLSTGETWQYTASYTVTQNDINTLGNGSGFITNTVTADSAQTNPVTASASVVVENPNHPVMFTSGPDSASLSELADTTGSAAVDSTSPGSLTFTDQDTGDTHSLQVTVASTDWSGGSGIPAATLAELPTALATVLNDSTGTGNGSVDWTFNVTDGNLDFLAAGETLTVVYDVQVSDAFTSSTQTVTVTIDGANDAVNITSGPQSGSVEEQPNLTGSSSLDSTSPSPTGTLAFTDVDLSDVHSVSVSLDSAVWSVGPDAIPPTQTFIDLQTALNTTLHDSTGAGSGGVDWTFSIPDKDLDFLSAGETLTATYIVTVSDGATSSSQTVTITATGAEDALTANPVTAGLADTPFLDAGVTTTIGNLLTEGTSQGDASNAITVTEINGDAANIGTPLAGAHGTLLVSADGTYTYMANSALDPLQDGDTATDHFTFTVMDSLGATATESLDFNITGTNDFPQVTGGVFFGDVVQNAGPTTTVNGGFEAGDLSGWFATSNVFAELLAFGPPLGNYDALLSGTGSLEQDVATTPGQHYQLSFYVAGDADASGTSFTAYWDGAPVLAQTDVALGFTHYTFDVVGDATDSTTQFFVDYATDGSGLHFDELSVNPTPGPATESTSGSVAFSDVETGDTHTASFTPDNSGYVGTFSLDPVSESAGTGSVAWHFSVDNADIAFLTPGQTLTQTYAVAIADNHGGTTTQDIGVTIHANDFLV